jgi:hypothetical protein
MHNETFDTIITFLAALYIIAGFLFGGLGIYAY